MLQTRVWRKDNGYAFVALEFFDSNEDTQR